MSSAANLYPAPGTLATSGLQQATGIHAAETGAVTRTVENGVVGAAASGAPGLTGNGTSAGTPAKTGKLVAFEGFLKRAGQMAGVVLSDVLKYAIPVASVVSVADPSAAPVVEAFTASVKLVQATVVAAQQRWTSQGSAANTQKLGDVLEIVEQPILTMFSQAGVQVDTAYITNLVNGVVAILNAQPASMLPSAG